MLMITAQTALPLPTADDSSDSDQDKCSFLPELAQRNGSLASSAVATLEEEVTSARCMEIRSVAVPVSVPPSMQEESPVERSIGTGTVAVDLPPSSPQSARNGEPQRKASSPSSSIVQLRELKKLYGRSSETEALANAYERAMAQGGANLAVIEGGVGIGKTAIAQSLRDRVTSEERGFFITWKFDNDSQLETGDGFYDAFTSLRDQVLHAGEDVLRSVRDSIRELGPVDSAILLGVIPMLAPIIGEAEVDIDPFGVEASGRGLGIFKKMMRAFCTKERPLVVLFDDVQFSDSCSHLLLESLVRDTENEGIFYIFTLGPEEPTAPMSKLLNNLKESVNTTFIELEPLNEETTNLIIADTLRVELEDSTPMAKFLYYCTKGNPLFVKEMLCLMLENGVLAFDEGSRTWHCHEERMDCVYRCTDFQTLVRHKLCRFCAPVREALKAAACLGTKIDASILQMTVSEPVAELLARAVASGLVAVIDEESGTYRFASNEVQQTVFALIPEDEMETLNLTIGRKLLKRFNHEQIDEQISLILRLMKRGAGSITNQKERYSVVALCFRAGQQAVEWSSFRLASEYLDFGISLLSERCWRDEYDLSLALYNMASEVAYTTGSHEKVHQRTNTVLSNARTLDHKLPAYCTKVSCLSATAKFEEAIDLGLHVLRLIGEPVRSTPREHHLLFEYAQMRRFMKGKSPARIRRLPTMTDHRKAAAMQIVNLLAVPTIFNRQLLMPLLAFKSVRLTLTHGLCAVSGVAFGLYGMVIASYAEKYDEANEMGELALELLERFDARQWLPRVHVAVYSMIFGWTNDLGNLIEPLQRGYEVGIESGDFEFAILNANMKCVFMFAIGTPLPIMKEEIDKYTGQIQKLNQESMLVVHKSLRYMIEAFMEDNSSETFDRLLSNDSDIHPCDVTNHCWFLFKMLAISYTLGNYRRAIKEADAMGVSNNPIAGVDASLLVLLDALARVAYCKQTGKNLRKTLATSRKSTSKLTRYAKANPGFCLGMLHFLEAEIAALRKKKDVASEKYLSCVSIFAHRKMLLYHGLASERAGKFLLEHGRRDAAKDYLCDSSQTFGKWGAKGKSKTLSSEIEQLFGTKSD